MRNRIGTYSFDFVFINVNTVQAVSTGQGKITQNR